MTMMMMKADSVQKEMEERNLHPRLCYLTKGERGYGFHLHGECSSGAQFIRRIEAGSPAELAGLRSGDRVVEVNGENVEKHSHQEVVKKIMEVENRTRLLVVDRETDEFLHRHSLPCSEDFAVEMSCLLCPRTPSSSLASSTLSFSSLSRNSLTPSPQDSIILSPRDFITHSLSDSITPSLLPTSNTSTPLDPSAPLPSDSIIPSPQHSTPSSPGKSVTTSPDSITQSSRNSVNQSPRDSVTPSLSNSIIQSPSNSITQSPSNSITQSPSNSITQSPYNSITQSPSNSITQSPYNSITQSPSNSITQSPYNSITQSPAQSPSSSITQSPSNSISTPFSREKSNETHVMDTIITNNNKEMSGTEDMAMHDLRPRLCHIVTDKQGFGFNLHCDKRRVGQFIRSVDPDSPAQRAGLQPGDRLIQVNGRSIEGLRHSEVVKIIRGAGGQAKLLVVDPETDALFQKLDITPTTVHLNEDCVDGPIIQNPTSTCPITESSESPSKISNGSLIQPPITNLPLTDPPSTNGALKLQSHESSSSSRSIILGRSMELSSSDTSNEVRNSEQRKCNSAPSVQEEKTGEDSDPLRGLHLSPTAAEARQKVRLKKANKRAPPMAWNKKYEIFSNF